MKVKILVPVYNDWQSVFKLLDEIDHNISEIDHEIRAMEKPSDHCPVSLEIKV